MLLKLLTALAVISFSVQYAEAETKKYPSKPGVNCGQKHDKCAEKCKSTNPVTEAFASVRKRNECLNNCTVQYDLCLGAPAIQQEESGGGGVLGN